MTAATRANTIAIATMMLVAVSVMDCTERKLSKEEAAILLANTAAETSPICSLEGGSAKALPVGDKDTRIVTFDDQEWGRLASDLGFLKDIKCDPEKTDGKCRGLAPQAQLNCTQPLPYFAFGDCTFTRPCGSSTVEVDAIVTEGNRATIRYTLKPIVEPKVAAITSPVSSKLHINGRAPVARTATVVRTDDGKWLLEKK